MMAKIVIASAAIADTLDECSMHAKDLHSLDQQALMLSAATWLRIGALESGKTRRNSLRRAAARIILAIETIDREAASADACAPSSGDAA